MDLNVYIKDMKRGPVKDRGIRMLFFGSLIVFGFLYDKLTTRIEKLERKVTELETED